MKKILCFGEILLRLSPRLDGEWLRENRMECFVGGAELNVASALALWGMPVQYLSASPAHYLSEEIIRSLTSRNIDCSQFIYSGDRIGTYYLPQGADLKHASVIYDRAGSSFAGLQPGTIDWDQVLDGITWVHLSAISPALSLATAQVCEEAVQAASRKNIMISLDLNYRSKLWQYGIEPVRIMPAIAAHCHLLMGNIWSANSLLGIALDPHIHDRKSKQAYIDHAAQTASLLRSSFPSCKIVANSFRFDRDGMINYFATLDNEGVQVLSREYFIESASDRVGTGDCFMAGLIYGFNRRHGQQDIVDFAAAAATGKFGVKGDVTDQTVEDIRKAMLDKEAS